MVEAMIPAASSSNEEQLAQQFNEVLSSAADFFSNMNDILALKTLNQPPANVTTIFSMLHAFKTDTVLRDDWSVAKCSPIFKNQ